MNARRLAERFEALRGVIEFELDGRTFVVPEHPVLDWLQALLSVDDDAIVPGLLDPDDQAYLYERLLDLDAPLEVEVCREVGEWVVSVAADRPVWEAERAAGEALAAWHAFDAWCATEGGGIDPLALPLRRFCSLVVRFVVSVLDAEEREAWYERFTAPPPGSEEEMERRPEWAEEAVEADFTEAMGAWGAIAGSMGSAVPAP